MKQVVCPSCGKEFRVKNPRASKVRCKCGDEFSVQWNMTERIFNRVLWGLAGAFICTAIMWCSVLFWISPFRFESYLIAGAAVFGLLVGLIMGERGLSRVYEVFNWPYGD